jgi:hypothetical protein
MLIYLPAGEGKPFPAAVIALEIPSRIKSGAKTVLPVHGSGLAGLGPVICRISAYRSR